MLMETHEYALLYFHDFSFLSYVRPYDDVIAHFSSQTIQYPKEENKLVYRMILRWQGCLRNYLKQQRHQLPGEKSERDGTA